MPYIRPSADTWRQFESECASQPPQSSLQTLRLQFDQGELEMSHKFAQLHSNITQFRGSDWTREPSDEKLWLTTLAGMRHLTDLSVPCITPSIIRDGLEASGALLRLIKLDVTASDAQSLRELLALISRARSLQHAIIHSSFNSWLEVKLNEAKACTRHVLELSLVCEVADGRMPAAQAIAVTQKLLLLPSLVTLTVTGDAYHDVRATGVLTDQELADFRRTAGLNSVNIMCSK